MDFLRIRILFWGISTCLNRLSQECCSHCAFFSPKIALTRAMIVVVAVVVAVAVAVAVAVVVVVAVAVAVAVAVVGEAQEGRPAPIRWIPWE